MRSLTLGLSLTLPLLLAGCNGDAPSGDATATSSTASAIVSDGTEDAEALLTEKSNVYTDCFNAYSDRITDSANRYYSWVDPDSGPTGNEPIVYGLYTINDPADCVSKAKAASALSPRQPALDDAGIAYADAVKAVYDVTKQADLYYSQGDYKDDGFAKGRALHPAVAETFAAYFLASDELTAALDGIETARDGKELDRLEAQDHEDAYYLLKTRLGAKKLMVLAREKQVEEIDAAAYEAALTDLQATIRAMDAYAVSHSDAENASQLDTYVDASNQFLTYAKDLQRRIRDKQGFTPEERGYIEEGRYTAVQGSPGWLIDGYNKLVELANEWRG